MTGRIAGVALAAAWAAGIWAVSSIPMHRLPATGPLPFDKLAHALVFGVLAWLVLRAVVLGRPPSRLALVAAVAAAAAWGVVDEIHQRFVPGRHPSVADAVADAVGAAVAVWWARAAARRSRLRAS